MHYILKMCTIVQYTFVSINILDYLCKNILKSQTQERKFRSDLETGSPDFSHPPLLLGASVEIRNIRERA